MVIQSLILKAYTLKRIRNDKRRLFASFFYEVTQLFLYSLHTLLYNFYIHVYKISWTS